MRIALAQVPCALGDKKENLDRMRKIVESGRPTCIVFPELFLTGYMCRDEVHRLAEGLDGKSVRAVQQLAEEHGSARPVRHGRAGTRRSPGWFATVRSWSPPTMSCSATTR